jgi:hypothetical protein
MATANGSDSGEHTRRHDDEQPDPDRTQRFPAVQNALDEWFSDNQPQDGGHVTGTHEEADAVFASDADLIEVAANETPDPEITRAEQLAEWITGARRARAECGGA